ncbi:MAG: hypothetical protein EZS28_035222 [Streblomastix strix]|uniref:Uncharacterized protein n=1 Tax=Streblomastix strix TaxID=222440 RepID=A0A5J4UGR4_9EUKA|nr:MAG: hypothetical protein EZS28_035222 [Streblomastix strix]
MSFAASDYLKRLASAQHSDYINSYSQLQEVLQTQTIFPQSFSISKQQFFDQPVTQLTNDGAHYTRAPLAARGTATCSCVQTCQVSWQITIPKNALAIQINMVATDGNTDAKQIRQRSNYNAYAEGIWSEPCAVSMESAICKDSQKLWDTSIYAREQAIIASNSLTDQRTANSVTVSPLESIVQGKRHCGVFIDIPVSAISVVGAYNYLIPDDIIFSGVMDLNQLNPIFNSFPVMTRNYASLYIQLWMQDFLQDLKVVWLNKYNPQRNTYLAYTMIPPEKPDIICLRDRAMDTSNYDNYNIRLVNMQGKTNTEKMPTATISQIKEARISELYINNICFSMENEEVIIDMIRNQRIINFPTQVLRTQSSNYPASNICDGGGFIQTIMSFANIKSMFVTFAMPQYPTWFFPVLFKNIDLIIDQRHVIPAAYPALIQDVCGQVFDCFVDQDVVSAPSDFMNEENQGGTDPRVIGLALQYTLGPSLQNPPFVSTLFKPHKIGLPAEQLTDPFDAPLVAPVPAITDPLKPSIVSLDEFGLQPKYIPLQLPLDERAILIPSVQSLLVGLIFICVVFIADVAHPKYSDEYSELQFQILIPLLNVPQVRPVGLTYIILIIIPPLAKSQVIGIYAALDTVVTTSYVNISVILLVQQVLQSDTTIEMLLVDSILTYAEQIADEPDPI